MAQYRADKSGVNAEVQKKLEECYNEDLEEECKEWMEGVVMEPFPPADYEDVQAIGRTFKGIEFHVSLKDGTYLLKLIKALNPDARVRIPATPCRQPFKQRDLINCFIQSCVAYGVPQESMFETEDLHSAVNMNMVLCSLVALGSAAQRNGYEGPTFGPKLAEKNVREFDEEVLQEGNLVIGLQMGSNMGASQSGMTPYGQGRQIYDSKIVENNQYKFEQ